MAIKVYLKRGNLNYKERKIIDKVQQAIIKKAESNPDFVNKFKAATTFEELKQLEVQYCAEDVEFVETKTVPTEREVPEMSANPAEKKGIGRDISDPLNRENPKIRDYVLQEEFADTGKKETHSSTFDEPLSFKEAFDMPDDENDDNSKGAGNNQAGNSEKKSQKATVQPINPAFDDMSVARQKKSTKRFAKSIVEAVCLVSEKGFVWYANKDINDAKLAEYEINDEIDLGILITLEESQQVPIKTFFQIKCQQAEELSKTDPETKEELIDSLYEVMLEKKIAPTPTQVLAMSALRFIGEKGLNLMALKAETSAVLNQLKAMRVQEIESGQSAPRHHHAPPPQPQPEEKQEAEIEEEPKEEENEETSTELALTEKE